MAELCVHFLNDILSFHMHFPVVFIHACVRRHRTKSKELHIIDNQVIVLLANRVLVPVLSAVFTIWCSA